MGLFASVIHVKTMDALELRACLDAELLERGFRPARVAPVPSEGPTTIGGFEALVSEFPSYLLSTGGAPWLTIIEASFVVDGAPWLSELSAALGARMQTLSLSFMVHDDDVFFYNLDRAGEPLDGYNSCPQYFERERLSEEEIEGQRHTPDAFRLILSDDEALHELRDILDRGWWRAHDSGRLDEDGVPPEDEAFPFDSEAERMGKVADLLRVPGGFVPYPYAEWRSSSVIDWSAFEFVAYSRGGGAG